MHPFPLHYDDKNSTISIKPLVPLLQFISRDTFNVTHSDSENHSFFMANGYTVVVFFFPYS